MQCILCTFEILATKVHLQRTSRSRTVIFFAIPKQGTVGTLSQLAQGYEVVGDAERGEDERTVGALSALVHMIDTRHGFDPSDEYSSRAGSAQAISQEWRPLSPLKPIPCRQPSLRLFVAPLRGFEQSSGPERLQSLHVVALYSLVKNQ
jgi:hypothetical protein